MLVTISLLGATPNELGSACSPGRWWWAGISPKACMPTWMLPALLASCCCWWFLEIELWVPCRCQPCSWFHEDVSQVEPCSFDPDYSAPFLGWWRSFKGEIELDADSNLNRSNSLLLAEDPRLLLSRTILTWYIVLILTCSHKSLTSTNSCGRMLCFLAVWQALVFRRTGDRIRIDLNQLREHQN